MAPAGYDGPIVVRTPEPVSRLTNWSPVRTDCMPNTVGTARAVQRDRRLGHGARDLRSNGRRHHPIGDGARDRDDGSGRIATADRGVVAAARVRRRRRRDGVGLARRDLDWSRGRAQGRTLGRYLPDRSPGGIEQPEAELIRGARPSTDVSTRVTVARPVFADEPDPPVPPPPPDPPDPPDPPFAGAVGVPLGPPFDGPVELPEPATSDSLIVQLQIPTLAEAAIATDSCAAGAWSMVTVNDRVTVAWAPIEMAAVAFPRDTVHPSSVPEYVVPFGAYVLNVSVCRQALTVCKLKLRRSPR